MNHFLRRQGPASLLGFISLLLAACGASADVSVATGSAADSVTIAPPPAALEPMDYLPAETYALLTVDVGRLRSSPYYPAVVEALKSTDEMPPEEEEVLHQLLERTEKAWLAVVPHGTRQGGDVGCILFEGQYDRGQIESALQALLTPSEREQLHEVDVAGHRGLESGSGMVVELDDQHWLMGPPQRVRALVQSPPGGITAMADPAWEEAEGWLRRPQAGIGLVALGTPQLQHDLTQTAPMSEATAAHVRAAALSFDAADGMDAEGMILMDDPAVAEQVVAWLQAQLEQFAGSVAAGMLGLGPILETVEIRTEGPVAGARAHAPDSEVQRLLGLVPALLTQLL